MLVAGKPQPKGTPISKNVFRGKIENSLGICKGGGWGNPAEFLKPERWF
jgi:hypothetical protein